MHVGLVVLGHSASTGSRDDVAFPDPDTLGHGGDAEMHEGDGIAVLRQDRHRAAVRGHDADERDDPCRRRDHRGPFRGADVDTAMLAAGVRIVAEQEWLQHGTFGRPCPGASGRRADQQCAQYRERDSEQTHRTLRCLM